MSSLPHLADTGPVPAHHGTLHLVRHGETDWNTQGRKHGRLDIPLNPTGQEQAAELAYRLQPHHPHAILTSPLVRATETATVIGRILGLTPIIHPDLTERSFGIAEGWTEDQIRTRYVTDDEIPGRESNTDILARVAPIIADLPAGAVVVTHHGVIRSLGATGPIPNASIHHHPVRNPAQCPTS